MSRSWTPFYWGDYLKHTMHLTTEQHGMYLLLLCHYYTTEKPLPADHKQLLSICRCFASDLLKQNPSMQLVLDQFFVRDGDVYRHTRCDQELEKAREISEKRANAGKKGGQANAKQLLPQPQPHIQPQVQLQPPSVETSVVTEPKVGARNKFRAPSASELREYCAAENLTAVDPDQFLDHYTANGWKVGQAAMKDWKATARNWHRREKANGNGKAKPTTNVAKLSDADLVTLAKSLGVYDKMASTFDVRRACQAAVDAGRTPTEGGSIAESLMKTLARHHDG